MTKYLCELGSFYQPKNKLHKAIQEFIQQQHRRVIPADKLTEYEKILKERIEILNKLNPKCTPVEVHFWKSIIDEHLHLENVVSLAMLKFEDI